VVLRSVVFALVPTGDAPQLVCADNIGMTMELLARVRGSVDPADAARVAGCCSHTHLPDHPAADGYRYHDLGGELPPFYVRRLEFDGRIAAITLAAPLEWTSGDDAEPGAPAVARVGVSYGARSIALADAPAPELLSGESALLARLVFEALLQLPLLEAAECPICSDRG
jgi:hypothetical protein